MDDQLFVHENFKGTPLIGLVILSIIQKKYSNVCIYDMKLLLSFTLSMDHTINTNGIAFMTYNNLTFIPLTQVKQMIQDCTREFLIIQCTVGISTNMHSTFIIINTITNSLEYYDPHGSMSSIEGNQFDNILFNDYINNSINDITAQLGLVRDYPPHYLGTQSLADYQGSNVEDIGYCTIHTLIMIFFRLTNDNMTITEVTSKLHRQFSCLDINNYTIKTALKVMKITYKIAEYYGIYDKDMRTIYDKMQETNVYDIVVMSMFNNTPPFDSLSII